MNVALAQFYRGCIIKWYCWPLVNKNCKQGAPEFYLYQFFFFASSVYKVLFQQFHVGIQHMKGSGACHFWRTLTSFFETQAQRKPDSWSLLTLSAQASLKHPRAFGEVQGRAWQMLPRHMAQDFWGCWQSRSTEKKRKKKSWNSEVNVLAVVKSHFWENTHLSYMQNYKLIV